VLALLFSLTLLELFLGGGGRWTAYGPISLRMVLFVVCLAVGWLAVLFPKRRYDGMPLAFGLVGAYLVIHLSGLIAGATTGTDTPILFTELQHSLYWLAAPFFACTLSLNAYIQRTATLVQLAGFLLALAYIALVICLTTGVLSLATFFAILPDNGEVISRGTGLLFYKGDLYLGIALVFLVSLRSRYWRPKALFMVVALILTLTRGFILSTSVAILMLLALQRRRAAFVVGLLIVAIAAAFVWFYFPSLNEGLSSNRVLSNQQRLDDMDFMWSNTSLKTVFFGEGLGSLIDDRVNIENTFLWALWKLGLAGLAFWLMPLVLCMSYFAAIPNGRENRLASAFLCGTILVYAQTLTNPYLNNPIGLSFVLISVFSLRTIAKGGGITAGLTGSPTVVRNRGVVA
jgi:hypothetical protein